MRTESTPGVRLASMRFFLVGATSNIAVERDRVSRMRLLLRFGAM